MLWWISLAMATPWAAVVVYQLTDQVAPLREACVAGSARSCELLASVLTDEAPELLDRACRGGLASACVTELLADPTLDAAARAEGLAPLCDARVPGACLEARWAQLGAAAEPYEPGAPLQDDALQSGCAPVPSSTSMASRKARASGCASTSPPTGPCPDRSG